MAQADHNTPRCPKGRWSNNLPFPVEGVSNWAHEMGMNTMNEHILVYHCCVTYYHKLGGFKCMFLLLSFYGSESRHGITGFSAQGSFQAAIQVWLTEVSLKAWWKNPLPASLSGLLEFLSL